VRVPVGSVLDSRVSPGISVVVEALIKGVAPGSDGRRIGLGRESGRTASSETLGSWGIDEIASESGEYSEVMGGLSGGAASGLVEEAPGRSNGDRDGDVGAG
jgi:hypothetical protein